jgi:UPF0716 protein FxsA
MRAFLIIAFIVVPLVELAIIIQVGQLIGPWWTILLLLAVSLAGAWLVRREGTRAWSQFRGALAAGRVPADEVLTGALVLFGGALLLTPGFATDALGLALMLPPVRAAIGTGLQRQLGSRFTVTTIGGFGESVRRPPPQGRRPGVSHDEVVDVEVVSIERSGGPESNGQRSDVHRPDGGTD